MDDEIHLKILKDQLNSLKPVPNLDIDLSDYNSHQFNRSVKNMDLVKGNEVEQARKLHKENTHRPSKTRDISYRKDISRSSHRRSASRGNVGDMIK